RRVPWAAIIASTAAVAMLIAGAVFNRPHEPLLLVPRELAVLPLEVDGAQPLDPLGSSIAYLVQLELANVPGFRLTSRTQVDDWWQDASSRVGGVDAVTGARALHARW